jgi:predicted nucleic acid-binding protein
MTQPKLYLDNCCFNRPFDDQSQLLVRLETEAKLFIQRQIKEGKIEIVWSAVLDFEIKRSPYKSRQEASDVFRHLAQIIVSIDDELKHSSLVFQARGLAWADALHIASAIKAECEYFITVDKRILNKPITEVAVLNPIQFVQLYENEF